MAYRKLVIWTTLITALLLALGAYVRLSDAGLGCPDWPGCYGKLSPAHAAEEISAAQQAHPTGPVSMGKAWKEMIHRFVASGVGLLIIAITIMAWRQRERLQQSPLLASVLLPLVIFQGLLGMWTVTLLLKPAIVTSHLIGGMTLLGLLSWLAMRQVFTKHAASGSEYRHLRGLALLALLVLACQIILGGWVSTNYAATVCSDFPTCQGQWWPQTDFRHAFHVLRELGETPDGQMLTQANLTAIHMVHRLGALLTLLVVGAFAWRAQHAYGLTRHARIVLALLLLQVSLGIGNILLQLPLAVAVAHNLVAALLLCSVVTLNYRVWTGRIRSA
ncbi:COX15/CtaA family protein [Leeia aquatica]|uniref:Heme A synthase n=1 Tax=Leeia aquatica TaxID=2725557 RepID=A0A847SBR8_9NEIS|nr:COX15/CtaA family protein [Leeia aquatica]NLR74966.1 heme A synthase [Leeia aquatica]